MVVEICRKLMLGEDARGAVSVPVHPEGVWWGEGQESRTLTFGIVMLEEVWASKL